jgi:hypothetical protein
MKFDLDPGFGSLPSAFEHGFRDACPRVSFFSSLFSFSTVFLMVLFSISLRTRIDPCFSVFSCNDSGWRVGAWVFKTVPIEFYCSPGDLGCWVARQSVLCVYSIHWFSFF